MDEFTSSHMGNDIFPAKWNNQIESSFFIPFLELSGTVCNITEAITGLLYQPLIMDDDECGAVGRMVGWGNRSTRRKPDSCLFVHHKSHMN
jgi:hypothetical protein